MKQTITVGIDIGTSFTRVVVCDASRDGEGMPKILGVGIVPSRGIRHGYVVQKDEAVLALKRAVREAEKDSGHHIKSANLAIGGVGISAEYGLGAAVVSRADNIISKLDIEKAIADAETKLELKNKTILHAFPVIFRVDGKELPTRPEGTQGFKIEVKVLFVTCFQQHLEDLLAVVNEIGIRVHTFTATPIATDQLLLSELQRNFGCALIDIGAETVSVSVFENGTLTSLHVFGIGSQDITKDISLGLRVSPEEAENIKLGVVGFSTVSKKKLDEIVEARLSDIFELIDKYLKKIGRSGLLPAGAIIIGGGAHHGALEQVAKNLLRIPVKVSVVEFPIASPSGQTSTSKDSRIMVAYAVAMESFDHTTTSNHRSNSGESEGFIAAIKNFFKQLMP